MCFCLPTTQLVTQTRGNKYSLLRGLILTLQLSSELMEGGFYVLFWLCFNGSVKIIMLRADIYCGLITCGCLRHSAKRYVDYTVNPARWVGGRSPHFIEEETTDKRQGWHLTSGHDSGTAPCHPGGSPGGQVKWEFMERSTTLSSVPSPAASVGFRKGWAVCREPQTSLSFENKIGKL